MITKPIHLEIPNFTHNVWGGTWIAQFKGIEKKLNEPVGESWEFSGHPLHPNKIELESGVIKKLDDYIRENPLEILGKGIFKKWGARAPILVKLIDAKNNLSVQVHPGDDYAKKNENDSGKTESWIFLEAGEIYIGFKSKEGRDKLENNFDISCLNKVKVKKGDVYDLLPGTIHAIGKGSKLIEVQQSSGVTYRIWDWGRDRPMHVKKAMDVLDFKPHAPEYYKREPKKVNDNTEILIQHEQAGYGVNRIQLLKGRSVELKTEDKFHVLSVLSGDVKVEDELAGQGHTILIPAAMNTFNLTSLSTHTEIIHSYPM